MHIPYIGFIVKCKANHERHYGDGNGNGGSQNINKDFKFIKLERSKKVSNGGQV